MQCPKQCGGQEFSHQGGVELECRIQRDVAVRGRDVGGVIQQYTKFVKPAFDQFVAPSRKHADVIIPWGRCCETLLHTDSTKGEFNRSK
jgi:uridine kinase